MKENNAITMRRLRLVPEPISPGEGGEVLSQRWFSRLGAREIVDQNVVTVRLLSDQGHGQVPTVSPWAKWS